VVERGLLVASVTSTGGRQAIVEIIGPGGLFGTEALLGHGGAPLTEARWLPEVRAMVETHVAVLPVRLIGEALRDPAVAGWVCHAMSRQAIELRERLVRSLTLPVTQRLESVLNELAARYGQPVPGGTRIGPPVTQELLAAMAGATRESVNRAVHALVEQGKLVRNGRRYVVPS
jgi:CRP/FNR family transcriptional regulator